MKTVLDANVYVSAIFGGVPRQAVLNAFAGDHRVFLSPAIADELEQLGVGLAAKLPREGLKYWREAFLPMILNSVTLVTPTVSITLCRDPKDDAYLSLAATVEADCLVTGDKDLHAIPRPEFDKVDLQRLAILTPRQFVEL